MVAIAAATLTVAGAAPAMAQAAPPTFAHIFADHAVLQRDRPIAVWGRAAPRTAVTVTLAGRSVTARTSGQGRWRVTFPAMPAGTGHTLTVRAGTAATSFADIAVGDVYLCGGQSNMEFPARLSTNAWGGVASAIDPDLRFVTIPKETQPAPLDDLAKPAMWRAIGPDTVGEASAVCYYMARSLKQHLKVPVGFVTAAWGGTTIQGWIGAPSLRTVPAYAAGVAAVQQLATDPAAARATEERRQEAWWDAHDPAAATQRAWARPDFDDSRWPVMTPTGSWKDAGIPAFAAFDGVGWFRTTVDLTEAQARDANLLQLGPVDTFDTTWVNGVRVGGGSTAWVWRDYTVPAGVFRAGRNVIAVRVLSGGAGGGLTGQPANRGIKTASGAFIPLTAAWRYQVGMAARGLSIPAAPWDVPVSLTTLYNGMIAPLAGYGFKLAAWYQGESNVGAADEYATLLPLMMADWRRTLGQPTLPMLVVQLANYGAVATQPANSASAALRDVQAKVARADGHAGLAVSIDVGDRTDIHPTQKTVVGERLARAARAVAYGEPIAPGGPEAVAATRQGEDLIVDFRDATGGLRTYSSATAIGFEACDDQACRFVDGTPDGTRVILRGANRPGVTRVRYAWADSPYVNLYSADDLPAVPFELRIR
ncbi:glycoside hydrolase family 2 [Sphingomonas sp. Leaf17]|nr:glycoside hydrolase family 2 [Sphingomonas sp. Leaf17]